MSAPKLQIRYLIGGHITMKRKVILAGTDGVVRLPIPIVLIRHPLGNVLFDTGMHRDLFMLGSPRLKALSQHVSHELHPGQHVEALLALEGLGTADINIVINSHLHYDHCGGNDAFRDAKFLISRRELQDVAALGDMGGHGYDPRDYAQMRHVTAVEDGHDVFGDGTLTLLATPGHTQGHQSLLVRDGERRILLAADVAYLRDNIRLGIAPRLCVDLAAAEASIARLVALEREGWELVVGHDPDDACHQRGDAAASGSA